MKLLSMIKHKLKLSKRRSASKEKEDQQKIDQASLQGIFDNIGSVTAHMIIKRRIDKYIYAEYGIDGLINNARFAIERVSEANGKILKTLLVDKQTGKKLTLYYKSVDTISP